MNKTKTQKGITLIALIITIVVLLILAIVTIGTVKDSGIIGHAQNAASGYESGKEKENLALNEYDDEISKYYSNGSTSTNVPVRNPEEDPTDWDIAYSYNGAEWTKLTGGGNVEGQIVAKFYKKDVPIQPGNIYINEQNYLEVSDKEYSYRLVIEGNGDMPALGNLDTLTYVAWQEALTEVFTTKNTENCIMPYVTEIVVCDGINSIGEWSLSGGTATEKITLPNTLKKIGAYAFTNTSVGSRIIPSGVTEIGNNVFSFANLQEVRIPDSIIKIGDNAFQFNNSLTKVYIETISNDFIIGNSAFDDINTDAIIYVRNKEIADKIAAVTSKTISTDYNWK